MPRKENSLVAWSRGAVNAEIVVGEGRSFYQRLPFYYAAITLRNDRRRHCLSSGDRFLEAGSKYIIRIY